MFAVADLLSSPCSKSPDLHRLVADYSHLSILLPATLRRTVRIRLSLLLVVSRVAELLLRSKAVFLGLCVNLRVVQERKLLGCLHVGHLLDEALCEDDIDLLERAVLGLRVEEVDDRQEASVDSGEE